MKTKTIQEYRKMGYKIRVMHGRINGRDGQILPKGGVTVIEVTTPDGKTTVKGMAECSIKDSWNRKMGNKIALGRAMEQIGGE